MLRTPARLNGTLDSMRGLRYVVSGLWLSIPALVSLYPIAQGRGAEQSTWIVLSVVGLVGLPWNLVFFLVPFVVILAIASTIDKLGYGEDAIIFTLWLAVAAMTAGAHINGAKLIRYLTHGTHASRRKPLAGD